MSFTIILHDSWDFFDKGMSIAYPEVFDSEFHAVEKAKEIVFDEFRWRFGQIERIDDFKSQFFEMADMPEVRSQNGKSIIFNPEELFENLFSQATWYEKRNPQTIFQETLKCAGEWHLEQKFPGSDLPYLYHISCVANEIYAAKIYEATVNEFNLNYALALASLHDILEDTKISEDELNRRFGQFILWGVKALTKNGTLPKSESMIDSISRIKSSPKEVALVKMADRITNLLPPPKHWTKEKIKKYYEESNYIHAELADKSRYLGSRLAKKIKEYESYF